MTADQNFLKSAHIAPCEIKALNWMEWRSEELDGLRAANEQQAVWISGIDADRKMWKLSALAGWLFAALLFAAPVIERMGRE